MMNIFMNTKLDMERNWGECCSARQKDGEELSGRRTSQISDPLALVSFMAPLSRLPAVLPAGSAWISRLPRRKHETLRTERRARVCKSQ